MKCLFCGQVLSYRDMSGFGCPDCVAIDGKSACIYSERFGWMIVIDQYYLNIDFYKKNTALSSYNNSKKWKEICSIGGIMSPEEITLKNVKKKIELMKNFA